VRAIQNHAYMADLVVGNGSAFTEGTMPRRLIPRKE
jgi:hypothetical protein